MFFFTLIQAMTLLGLVGSINAHHIVTNIVIAGVDQGAGNAVRIPPNTDPVVDMKSTNMVCNVNGLKRLDRAVSMSAGDTVTFQWRTWPDGSQNPKIADSHQGPCAVYMKSVNSFDDPANGPGWFKVWHDGFKDGRFCTERLRDADGRMPVTIPKDLAGGLYLIRAEHLALHQAQNIGGAQWYIGCVQAMIYSTGGNARPSGVSIPGHAGAKDPGVHFNYWANTKPRSYTIPGPAPYVVTNAGGGPRVTQKFNHENPNCPVSNADWCPKLPLPAYTDETTCWRSSSSCWDQVKACFNSAPATGHKGCSEFENYCTMTQDECRKCIGGACQGTFPPPRKRSLSGRSDDYGKDTPQKRHNRKRVLRTAISAPDHVLVTVHLYKKGIAAQTCALIHESCSRGGTRRVCGLFAQACAIAVEKGETVQFPESSGRKLQALWLFRLVCDYEGLGKEICRGKYSKALEGFE